MSFSAYKVTGIGDVARCPSCGRSRKMLNIEPVTSKRKETMLHMTCRHCGMAALFFLTPTQQGFVGVGIVTDVDAHEVPVLIGAERVSHDDILSVHHSLKEFEGSSHDLIE